MSTVEQAELRERLAKTAFSVQYPHTEWSSVTDMRVLLWYGIADAILPLLEQHVEQRTAALVAELEHATDCWHAVEKRLVRYESALRSARAKQDDAYKRLQQAEAQQAALRVALEKYGHHRPSCPVGARRPCTCGLDAALAAQPTPLVDCQGKPVPAAAQPAQREGDGNAE